MLKKGWFWLLCLIAANGLAQEQNPEVIARKFAVTADTIKLETKAINPKSFRILLPNKTALDSTSYSIDFKKGLLLLSSQIQADSVTVSFKNYPEFLTKSYTGFENAVVVPNSAGERYELKDTKPATFKPFDGLTTSGSITRGVTVGNNRNATVNSNLDLQISGKISDKITLRASVQDSNIPLQDNGYSQRLDEFDQIFIELSAQKWNIRAGDLFLENRSSRLLNFNKKVQGLYTHVQLGDTLRKTDIFASGAVVRGQYARSTLTGLEGNQGPYKLRGNNGELYVLIISGSERIYVNGILLQRGENNHYTIDYNAGEITFTSLFPITSEMRIVVEYQYSDRNFTRFITYGGVQHQQKTWRVGGYIYSENDVKNQPLQQSLSPEQVGVLQNAGDNPDLMNAASAFEDVYSENKILYRKITVGTLEVFEYSNNPTDVLYNVRFSFVGNNLGNYILANTQAVGKIYEYVAPIGGVPQGNYEPIIRLIAPTKLQIATVLGSYNPSEKTIADFEIGVSNNDLNLFSDRDDTNNKGFAGKVNLKQRLLSKKITLDAFSDLQWVQQNFRTVERLFNIEFNRDWNLNTPSGNQNLFTAGLQSKWDNKGTLTYRFENLQFSENFNGNKHSLNVAVKTPKTQLFSVSSLLKSSGNYSASEFTRSNNQLRQQVGQKNWTGGSLRFENNREKLVATQQLSNLSQKFTEFGLFVGRGDSTKVFVETGFLKRLNDSLVGNQVQRVNHSDTYYIKSRLFKNETRNLSLFINFRKLNFENETNTQTSLNSRLLYTDAFFKKGIALSTSYENLSGTIPQQEFTYLEVEPGQGVYMWNDYNSNGIQELQEFEVAPFPDLAKYVRVFLPNQLFVQTHQTKFAQSLTLNPALWQNQKGVKKMLSHFYNQTAFTIDRKIRREGSNFDLNPFAQNQDNLLGISTAFRNSLFYNRGRQHHSVTYTYLAATTQNLLSVGLIKNENRSHQLQYLHLFNQIWLLTVSGKTLYASAFSDTYPTRNYQLEGWQCNPKLTYLFSKNTGVDIFYEYQTKENVLATETLSQNRLGASFTYSGKKQFTANGEFSFYQNQFNGNALSAVGFTMLEGLQPGKNQTWRLTLQKNLTQFLDINIGYQGRKSETSKTVHTGSIQLRAYF